MFNDRIIHRKESIILDAIDAIDKYGVQAVSTKAIAKKQGISEPAIFKHFPKKVDLMLGVLDYFSQYDGALIETVAAKQMNPKDAIRFFLDSFSVYYESYPAISAVAQSYEALNCDPELSLKVNKIFIDRHIFIKKQIENAQKTGIFKMDIDSELLTDIILGTFNRICFKWRTNSCSYSLREMVSSALDTILRSFEI